MVSERRGAESDITKSEREVLPNFLVLVVLEVSLCHHYLAKFKDNKSKLTEKRRLL